MHDVPFNRHLGFVLVERTREQVTLSLQPQEWFVQEGGVIHGGVIASFADTAAVYVVHPERGERFMTSIEFKVNFLRAGRVTDGELTATAKPVRIGHQVAVVEVDVHQKDARIATGLFTYLILR